MQIKKIVELITKGSFYSSEELKLIKCHVKESIESVEWPPGSGSFTLYPQSGKKRGEGNGVKPIKQAFVNNLRENGWELETKLDIATATRSGPIDATYAIGRKYFAVEWETGNISSSHRALNKMSIGILNGVLIGGILILPTRDMYQYLTDRVGNFRELEPYFDLWKSLDCEEGYLAIIAIEHDGVSADVPRIPKGTDGRALQ